MPNKTYSFKLLITGPGGSSTEYEIPIGITTIGREPDNLLQLDDRTVSRYHARLECVSGECSITDLGSSNGTFINKVKVSINTPIPLRNLDQVGLGPYYQMEFSQEELIEEEPPEKMPIEIPVNEPVEPPVPPEPLPPPPPPEDEPIEIPPPGLSIQFHHLIKYLPEIFRTEFMENFLGIFEGIQMPIVWTIDNFDLFLSPRTSPSGFLPWLANWYEAEFDSTWGENQRRHFLEEAWLIYARRGTKWSLARVLEIYIGQPAEVDDLAEDLRPHAFRVTIPVDEANLNRASVENLINHYKPAHTDYELNFRS
jgi:phage tail-like protein